MKTIQLAILVLGQSLWATGPTDNSAEQEKKKLHGTWIVVHAVHEGQALDFMIGSQLSIGDRKATANSKQDVEEITYRIDPGKLPKHIDFLVKGKGNEKDRVVVGIYQLDGGKLKVCVSQEVKNYDAKGNLIKSIEAKRPIAFDSNQGVLATYKREKP